MKLAMPLIVIGATALLVTGAAGAGTATRQQDRQQLKDGSCVAAHSHARDGAQTGTQARDRDQLKDGSCLTSTVAYRNGARNGAKNGDGARTHTHDRDRDRDNDRDRDRLHDGSCQSA
jgi:hypothetical protein